MERQRGEPGKVKLTRDSKMRLERQSVEGVGRRRRRPVSRKVGNYGYARTVEKVTRA